MPVFVRTDDGSREAGQSIFLNTTGLEGIVQPIVNHAAALAKRAYWARVWLNG